MTPILENNHKYLTSDKYLSCLKRWFSECSSVSAEQKLEASNIIMDLLKDEIGNKCSKQQGNKMSSIKGSSGSNMADAGKANVMLQVFVSQN